MKRILLLIVNIFFCSLSFAQQRQTYVVDFHSDHKELSCIKIDSDNVLTKDKHNECEAIFLSKKINIPLDQIQNFIAFSITWNSDFHDKEAIKMRYNFTENFNQKGEWKTLNQTAHYQNVSTTKVSELVFTNAESNFLQLEIIFVEENSSLSNLELHFYDPGLTHHVDSPLLTTNRNSCPCPQPNFQNRQNWCPNGDCTEHPDPSFTPVTHMIVHHSAGTNVSSDWAGVVRSIWDFHVNSNGWDDIGYNWLVDPNGVLYEGRGDDILGAHFCGTNSGTMGVCVMGDFTGQTASDLAKSKLVELLAWKSCDRNVDPLGVSFHSGSANTLMSISGHRDGCATLCPGDMFYPDLPTVRDSVAAFIAQECSELAAPSNLTLEYTDQMRIRLRWEDNSEGEDGFSIERSVGDNQNFSQIITSIPNAQQFQDSNVVPDTTYFYRVRAFSGFSYSGYSNEEQIGTFSVGIFELNNNKVTVFPNPVKTLLNITVDANTATNYTIQIMDIKGRIVKDFQMELLPGIQEKKIDISDLNAGIYLLNLSDKGVNKTFKIIKD